MTCKCKYKYAYYAQCDIKDGLEAVISHDKEKSYTELIRSLQHNVRPLSYTQQWLSLCQ